TTIDESEALSLLATHLVGEHRQFHSFSYAHQARQEKATSRIGDESNPRKGFDKTRIIGSDTHVTGKSNVTGCASGNALYRGHDWLWHGTNGADNSMIFAQVLADFDGCIPSAGLDRGKAA